MTARVLTGSKQEIARKVASLEGDVREAIVFVEDTSSAPPTMDQNGADIFAEMEPHMVNVGQVDYSRAGIYARKSGE